MLGSTIGATSFAEEYTSHKVKDFVEEIENLSQIAEPYPQSAYAALTHCIMGKWRYIMRTIEDIDTLFQPLEDVITQTVISVLTGSCHCSPAKRRLLSLPIRHGGLNIINPVISASGEYHGSQKISEPLKDMIVEQSESFSKPQLQSIKTDLRRQKQQEKESAVQGIRESLSPPKQRMMDLLGGKGSSSWLSVLPLKDQGFNLNKGKFPDALNLRYGWQMKNIPHHCKCGKAYSTDHAITCP